MLSGELVHTGQHGKPCFHDAHAFKGKRDNDAETRAPMQRTVLIPNSQASPGQLLRAYLAPQGPVRSSCQGQNFVVPRMHETKEPKDPGLSDVQGCTLRATGEVDGKTIGPAYIPATASGIGTSSQRPCFSNQKRQSAGAADQTMSVTQPLHESNRHPPGTSAALRSCRRTGSCASRCRHTPAPASPQLSELSRCTQASTEFWQFIVKCS